MTLCTVPGPSSASAPSSVGDAAAEQGATRKMRVYDCHSHVQAARAAHARHLKQLKLKRDLSRPKSPTKARVEPDWPVLLKEDPVRYMALYKVFIQDFPAKSPDFSAKRKMFPQIHRNTLENSKVHPIRRLARRTETYPILETFLF